MKTIVNIIWIIVFPFVLNAQEFKHFQVLNDGQRGMFLFPENFRQALQRLQEDQVAKFFSRDHLAEDDVQAWLVEHTCRVMGKVGEAFGDYLKWYEENAGVVPPEIRERLGQGMLERVAEIDNRLERLSRNMFFFVYMIVDREGEVLSPYFWIDSLVKDLVDENELLRFCDRLMAEKIDVSLLDFAHHSLEQDTAIDKRLHEYLDRKGIRINELDFKVYEQIEQEYPKIEADYGIVNYCSLRREEIPGLDYPVWQELKDSGLEHFTVWEYGNDGGDRLVLPNGFDKAYDRLRQAYLGKFVALDGKGKDDKDFYYWNFVTRVDWKTGVSKARQEELQVEWGKAIPASLSRRLEEGVRETVPVGAIYFTVYAIVNADGTVQDVYFQVLPCLMDRLRNEELRQIRDAFVRVKLDVTSLDFGHHTIAQKEDCEKRVKANLELYYSTLQQEYEKHRADYGILTLYKLFK